MNITKTLSTLSLAFAMVGGALVLAPSKAEAAGKFISIEALRKGGVIQSNKKPANSRPGQQANKWTRPCNAQNRCRG